MDNQITNKEELRRVLSAVEKYYNFNACTTKAKGKEKNLTISQLLLGCTELATENLRLYKKEEQDINLVEVA